MTWRWLGQLRDRVLSWLDPEPMFREEWRDIQRLTRRDDRQRGLEEFDASDRRQDSQTGDAEDR